MTESASKAVAASEKELLEICQQGGELFTVGVF